MIEKAIQKILDINKPQMLTVKDRQYFDRNLIPIKDPEPASLPIHTLTGIVDYVTSIDEKPKFIIHIQTHKDVFLTSQLKGMFLQRPIYLKAEHTQPVFQCSRWLDIETFIIRLQSMFVESDVRANILKIVGNLKDDRVKKVSDDGVSQAVTTKIGVATVGNMTVPNPVTLKPFRTFPEIDQPESLFVLRLASGDDKIQPSASLFEADGGEWQNEAIQSIKTWLSAKLPDIPIIA